MPKRQTEKRPTLTRVTIVTRLDPAELRGIVQELLAASKALSNAVLTLNAVVSKTDLHVRERLVQDGSEPPTIA